MNLNPGLNITTNLSTESSKKSKISTPFDNPATPVSKTIQVSESETSHITPPKQIMLPSKQILPTSPELTENPDHDIPGITATDNTQFSTPSVILAIPVTEGTQTKKNFEIPTLPETSHSRAPEQPVCSNCKTSMYGKFCHACGQKDFDYKRPLHQVWSDLFDSWFSLDNKTIRSVRTLFLQPGKLSSEFISGKRIHYTSPLKLFLFSSFFYFFILGITNDNRHIQISSETVGSTSETLPSTPVNDNTTDSQMSSSNSQTTRPIADSGVSANGSDRQSEISTIDIAISSLDDETSILKLDIAGRSPDELEVNENVSWIETRLLELAENPHRVTTRVNKALSYMFFALMPLFALLLMIFLKGKKRLYFEHFIFSVHLHTFGFFYLSLFVLFRFFTGMPIPFANWMMPIGIVLYLFLCMLHFYKMRWWVGLIRVPLITGIYMLLFIIVMVSSILFSITI